MSFRRAWQYCYHRFLKNPCPLKRFNRIAAFWCFFTIVSVWLCGVILVLPHLYMDSGDGVWMTQQIIANLIGLELLVNWLCIRYVDSGYVPAVHGSKPEPPLTRDHVQYDNTSDMQFSMKNAVNRTVNGTNETPIASSSPQASERSNNVERTSRDAEPHQSNNGSSSTMYVLSGFQGENGLPQRTAYTYWSWVPCIICNHLRPPRCHHCSLCGKCVLKRDHHCFFAGSCVGYRNMRHFTVFCLWGTIGCIYSYIHMIPYYYEVLYPDTSFLDLLPYVVHVRWLLGYTNLTVTYAITMAWSLFFFVPLTAHFFYLNIKMTINGQTTFEKDANVKVRDCRPLVSRIHSVFGHYFMFNIFVPLHHWYDVIEDPVYWPSIKP